MPRVPPPILRGPTGELPAGGEEGLEGRGAAATNAAVAAPRPLRRFLRGSRGTAAAWALRAELSEGAVSCGGVDCSPGKRSRLWQATRAGYCVSATTTHPEAFSSLRAWDWHPPEGSGGRSSRQERGFSLRDGNGCNGTCTRLEGKRFLRRSYNGPTPPGAERIVDDASHTGRACH